MDRTAIRVLFVEDSSADIELARFSLERGGFDVSWEQAQAKEDLERALASSTPQIIISDFSMPLLDGVQALRVARELAPGVPFIFLSGTIGEERAIEAMRLGATDYVLKNNLLRLAPAVRRALTEAAQRRAYEARLQYLANYDPLTGLANRDLLRDRASQAIAHARRSGRPAGLLVLNLDRFKLVNETFGPGVGDALLRMVGDRLRGAVREGDTVARLGADAFAVLTADLARPDDMLFVVRKIREAMLPPFSTEGHARHLTVSIGASTYPRDGQEFDILLRNADAAMHRVKAEGRNGVQFYAASMTQQATERVELENELRLALVRKELEVHYQPQVVLADGSIVGVEALMRWNHRQRGWIPPGQFIPVAEDSDLIHPLGEFALSESCRQTQLWSAAGFGPLRVAVNVSARQFRDPRFVEVVERALEESKFEPGNLDLELTESVLVEGRDQTLAILARLKELGVQISVDDFGTGYSSLSYLSRLPIDCLKIDRSFVSKAHERGHDAAITQAVISLAHSLGVRVIAEGVETAEQLEFLRLHRCDQAQGFLFSKAVQAEAMERLLASGSLAPEID
jgi:diguanylate cyclase (GGDEF)-like protein